MLKLVKIAVTGGLASGKSSVCRIFEEQGAYVISADEIVHKLLSLKTEIGRRVVNLLGSDVVENGHLNRKKIAEKVFQNHTQLRALEHILFPAVYEEIEKCYQEVYEANKYSLFIAEIPLLYESKTTTHFDYVICVVADQNLCRERFTQKTGNSDEEYEERMIVQMPLKEKAAKADYTIVNNGDFQSLTNQVYSLLKELRSNESRRNH